VRVVENHDGTVTGQLLDDRPPIPLEPPVTTAPFPSSTPTLVLLIVDKQPTYESPRGGDQATSQVVPQHDG